MTIFLMSLKRILKQPLNWVFILLFPSIFAVVMFSSSQGSNELNNSTDVEFVFGVADQDNSALSQALVNQLKVRYNVNELNEEDISAALTDSEVPWVLLIRQGYGRDVLAGKSPALESYSLTVSDVSALGSVTAENITRALMLLGSDDPKTLAAWEDASRVDVTVLEGDHWGLMAFWLGFYGYVSIFTAYFIIKTLLDDKRHGMPDRLGVLPATRRMVLFQGTCAAFLATELTAALMLTVIGWQLGTIPHVLHMFLLLSLYNLFSVGMVLAITSVAKDLGAASVAMTMIATTFSMLGGLFWPLEFVPEFMQRIAWFSPGYWLSRGLANIQEITFEGFGMPVLFLLGFTAVVMLLGGWGKVQKMED